MGRYDKLSPGVKSDATPIEVLRMLGAMLAAAIELLAAPPLVEAPEWYTSRNYPHGPRQFRLHIRRGMPAIRCGKAYRVRRIDAETFWANMRVRTEPRPAGDMRSALARAGIATGGGR